ncbi:hypothetical protein ABEB36_014811 [Hypothenemus hampei]|uniref:Uncharacterized protein n=1 Tax=Hypothenemus hampei TaxID=57062 RepID=A0ABD1E0Z5_HYPHA
MYRRTYSSDEDIQSVKNSNLFVATRKNHVKKISRLLNDGADINAKNGSEQAILHIAIKKNYKDVVEFLLKYRGIKIDVPNKDGETALVLAKHSDRQHIFQMLEYYNKHVADVRRIGVLQKQTVRRSRTIKNSQQGSEKQLSIQLSFQKRKASIHNDAEGNVKRVRLDSEDDDYYHKGGHSLHGTEVEDAEKFDDIVFNGQDEIRFVQAKHKQDESKRIIAHDLLTNKDDDFSLQKYFISYSKTKKKHRFNKGELKDFILYTNIKFDSADLENAEIRIEEIEENDDILIT